MAGFLRKLFGGGDADAKPTNPEPKPAPAALSSPQQSAFQPINALESLLIEATGNPDARPQFEAALRDMPLYAATPDLPSETGERTLASGEDLKLMCVSKGDGSTLPAVFTSERLIAPMFGAAGFIRLKGSDLLPLLVNDGFVLNPGQDYGVEYGPDGVAALLGQPVQRTIEQDTQVMLGTPAERPEALIATLENLFASEPLVEEAWLALAHWPARNEWAWFVDIRGPVDRQSFAAQIGMALQNAGPTGHPVDVNYGDARKGPGEGIRLKPRHVH